MDGTFQNSIKGLPALRSTRYENIFKLYTNDAGQYYYNLLQSVFLPDIINEDSIYYQQITTKMPWTIVSYNAYQTIELWWLICLANKVFNPVKFPDKGTLIKVIKPQYVSTILNEIKIALK